MDSIQTSLLILGFILVLGVQTGTSIQCHVCNSGYTQEQDCRSLPDKEAYVRDCDEIGEQKKTNYTYCRKVIQDVEGEVRTVRQCANHARLDRCIERTGIKDVKMTICECEGNKCNTGHSTFTMNILLLSSVSALLALIFNS